MSSDNAVLLFASAVAQWFTAAAAIWLTWWAAQSRDALVLRVLAMVLVVVPAMLWPLVTMAVTLNYEAVSRTAFLYGVLGAGVAVLRAVFLGIWAAVSRDRPYLRIGGAVIAVLQLAGLMVQGIGALVRW